MQDDSFHWMSHTNRTDLVLSSSGGHRPFASTTKATDSRQYSQVAIIAYGNSRAKIIGIEGDLASGHSLKKIRYNLWLNM